MFEASIESLIWRYNLLMALVVIGFVTEYYWISGLALPVFLSCLLGLSFRNSTSVVAHQSKNEVELISVKPDVYKKAA